MEYRPLLGETHGVGAQFALQARRVGQRLPHLGGRGRALRPAFGLARVERGAPQIARGLPTARRPGRAADRRSFGPWQRRRPGLTAASPAPGSPATAPPCTGRPRAGCGRRHRGSGAPRLARLDGTLSAPAPPRLSAPSPAHARAGARQPGESDPTRRRGRRRGSPVLPAPCPRRSARPQVVPPAPAPGPT